MSVEQSTDRVGVPSVGDRVEVRDSRWIVADVDASGTDTVVDLGSLADDAFGETLRLVWELEPGRRLLPGSGLPEVRQGAFDKPGQLAAFLDAMRWSALTSADTRSLQAPFRSGADIKIHQLEPVWRSLSASRVNQLLADDVGLGKTVEAGLVASELILRHRAERVMIVCPAGLTTKWQSEMFDLLGLRFTIVNAQTYTDLRREHDNGANPFEVYRHTIVSLPRLRGPKAERLLFGELLRAAADSDRVDFHRVTAVVGPDTLEDVFVAAYAKYTLTGADSTRLHQEIMAVCGWLDSRTGRFRRLENLTRTAEILDAALDQGREAGPVARLRLAERWTEADRGLRAALEWRTADELAGLVELELQQARRDEGHWNERLEQIDVERDRELAAAAARYAGPEGHRAPSRSSASYRKGTTVEPPRPQPPATAPPSPLAPERTAPAATRTGSNSSRPTGRGCPSRCSPSPGPTSTPSPSNGAGPCAPPTPNGSSA